MLRIVHFALLTLAAAVVGVVSVAAQAQETEGGPGKVTARGVYLGSEDVWSNSGVQKYEDQVMELVNQERWNNGQLPPLKRQALLDISAEGHSTNMAQRDFFAHCDLDTGMSPWERMQQAGYSWNTAAENIAAGYGSPASVMVGWLNSPGNRSNILSTTVRELGLGYYYESGDQHNVRYDSQGDCVADSSNHGPFYSYWTQNFGCKNNYYPVIINREAYATNSRTVNLYVYGDGWAEEMRFSNDGSSWSAWEPFASDKTWTLPQLPGERTVYAEIRYGDTILSANDKIVLEIVTDLPVVFYFPYVAGP